MNEYEQVEIPDQYKKRTATTQTQWTKEELVPHVIRRLSDPNIARGKKIKDATVTTNVIIMQATHIEEESISLLNEAETLRNDLERRVREIG